MIEINSESLLGEQNESQICDTRNWMIHIAGMSALPPLPQTPQLPKSERHDSRAAVDSTYYTVSDETSGQTGENDADNLDDMVGT